MHSVPGKSENNLCFLFTSFSQAENTIYADSEQSIAENSPSTVQLASEATKKCPENVVYHEKHHLVDEKEVFAINNHDLIENDNKLIYSSSVEIRVVKQTVEFPQIDIEIDEHCNQPHSSPDISNPNELQCDSDEEKYLQANGMRIFDSGFYFLNLFSYFNNFILLLQLMIYH